jgi:hypothetical protein
MNVSYYRDTAATSTKEISRLLTAAVINQRFCRLLLANPANALACGYNGESFRLGSDVENRVLSIQAKSLAEFASQLMDGRTLLSH